MPDSKATGSNTDRSSSSHLVDAFGVTADIVLAGDFVTGSLMKGAEVLWRALDRKIAEEIRQKQS